jgi:hypothetical protein
VRVLAKRAGLASVAREEREGRETLVVRASDGSDLRDQLDIEGRRNLERSGAVTIGRSQLRIDLDSAANTWRDLLLDALGAASSAVLVA